MCIIGHFVHNNVRFEKKYMTNMEATKKVYDKYESNGLYIHFETVTPQRKRL